MTLHRNASKFVVVVFLAVIMAPGTIQTLFELRSGERPRALDMFRQPPTAANLHAYEHSLEETSLVVSQLRPRIQYLEWRFLSDAGENAVLGRDGWLFYRPSVQYATERPYAAASAATSEVADAVRAIRSFRDQLQERGIRLLVVPVPGKQSVYPGMLARRAEGAGVVVCEPTRRLLEQLDQSGIDHVDLFQVFRRAMQEMSPSQPRRLYLAKDSHWTPEGARLAAAAVAHHVLDAGTVVRGNRAYALQPLIVSRHGDLVEMMHAPQIQHALEPESVDCTQVVESASGTRYHDAPESEILVLGDSFLRIYEDDEPGSAGFNAHLARELGQSLSAIVNDGGASTLVRQALARRPALLQNKKVVIWEFAERDIRYGTEGWKIVPLAR